MEVVYEDNHIIIVNKKSGEIVQGDKTGDRPLSDIVKDYIKEKYDKPGAVFLGVVHRLDRPVSGLVVFARTSKALSRLNKMFAEGEVHKTYWAIVKRREGERRQEIGDRRQETGGRSQEAGEWQTLTHWLVRNEKQNKSYAYDHEKPNAKKAVLKFRVLSHSDNYSLLEVNLMTGRHHQIRCQLAAMGCPIKGDLKYGAPRSNPDGSISLMSRRVEFVHPVSKEMIIAEAPLPDDKLWRALDEGRCKMEDVRRKK
jgi:23S rRNA pseudouridine1911/1915/1917 synthase